MAAAGVLAAGEALPAELAEEHLCAGRRNIPTLIINNISSAVQQLEKKRRSRDGEGKRRAPCSLLLLLCLSVSVRAARNAEDANAAGSGTGAPSRPPLPGSERPLPVRRARPRAPSRRGARAQPGNQIARSQSLTCPYTKWEKEMRDPPPGRYSTAEMWEASQQNTDCFLQALLDTACKGSAVNHWFRETQRSHKG